MIDTMNLQPAIGVRVTFRDGDTTREGLIVGVDRWACGGLRVIVKTDDMEFVSVGADALGAIVDGKTDL